MSVCSIPFNFETVKFFRPVVWRKNQLIFFSILRFVQMYNNITKYLWTTVFLWTALGTCNTLLMLQMQIVEYTQVLHQIKWTIILSIYLFCAILVAWYYRFLRVAPTVQFGSSHCYSSWHELWFLSSHDQPIWRDRHVLSMWLVHATTERSSHYANNDRKHAKGSYYWGIR